MFVQSIVTDAIYMVLQDREHQPTINSGYEELGLKLLNFILSEWRDRIPFVQQLTFTNISQLQNSNFVEVNNVDYILNTTSTPLRSTTLTEFNYLRSVIGLTGFPQIYYFEQLTGSILVYPIPSDPSYGFIVWGRTSDPLTLFVPIPNQVTPFMVMALTYELAFRLATSYGVDWNQNQEALRRQTVNGLLNKKDIDLSPIPTSVFGLPSGGTPPFPFLYYLSGGRSH